jgi:putative tryptophan/tyrosine transport system substrate-binding protein
MALRQALVSMTVASALLGSLLTAAAQSPARVYRIGILMTTPVSPNPPLEAFLQKMRDLGYVEGSNLVLEYRSTDSGQA